VPNTDAVRVRKRAIKWFPTLCVALAALVATAGVAVAQEPVAQAAKVRTLHKGDHGKHVELLQRALGVPADGEFGRRTWRALRRFQRAHGLTVDGVAGPATLAALGVGAAREATAETGTRVLQRIAMCESGGNPRAISPNRRYRGKYQFTRATWRALGGSGDPAKAPEAEQDARAAKLYAAEGTKPWPSCA
jgi:peptidoglycan hydrolase-like protein with peptidoglycan-binding domain